MQDMSPDARSGQAGSKLGLAVRVGVFAFLAVVGVIALPPLVYLVGDYLMAAAMGTFAAAAVANAVVLRIYERGRLADIGLGWSAASRRNLLLGVVGGAGAACLALAPPLVAGLAELRPEPEAAANWPSFLFVSIILLFGAVGEEMLFRGYGFQVLLRGVGPFATILPLSVLFGLTHTNNEGSSALSLANTIGWGVLLGVAFLRSGDLWLPIGLHYGWNWVLPLFGANVSGYRMGITGHAMTWKVSDVWSGGAYGPEGGLITSIVLAFLAVYLWRAPIQGQEAFLLHARREG